MKQRALFEAAGRWLNYRWLGMRCHAPEYNKYDALLQELAYGVELQLVLEKL